tara:strand:+ start:104 stop:289 length:186 start_codon:yes stop_codon:yes gene_type:complete
MKYRVIITANVGAKDIPEEFVSPPLPLKDAEAVAKIINTSIYSFDKAPKIAIVVREDYKLK